VRRRRDAQASDAFEDEPVDDLEAGCSPGCGCSEEIPDEFDLRFVPLRVAFGDLMLVR
jgi:hypothetical protein